MTESEEELKSLLTWELVCNALSGSTANLLKENLVLTRFLGDCTPIKFWENRFIPRNGPWTKFSSPLFFINKVLLEYSHTHLFMLSHYTAKLNIRGLRPFSQQGIIYLLSDLLLEKFSYFDLHCCRTQKKNEKIFWLQKHQLDHKNLRLSQYFMSNR